jgi:L-lactate dehydrogenase complex protein LldG
MSVTQSAREEILGRIRAALSPDPSPMTSSYGAVARTYRRRGELSEDARLELFIDRLIDYDSEVLHASSEAEISRCIEESLQSAHEDRVLASAELPGAWLPKGVRVIVDTGLTSDEIEGNPAVVTTCEAAVAATGTIILVHKGTQMRRVFTLLPDHHICLIRRDQIYELLPEALAAVGTVLDAPLTTISGPSATSDIEMTRIRGVHGPRKLTAIIY